MVVCTTCCKDDELNKIIRVLQMPVQFHKYIPVGTRKNISNAVKEMAAPQINSSTLLDTITHKIQQQFSPTISFNNLEEALGCK